jgi:DHA1 family multidrug resistance protein-like MFS transporter
MSSDSPDHTIQSEFDHTIQSDPNSKIHKKGYREHIRTLPSSLLYSYLAIFFMRSGFYFALRILFNDQFIHYENAFAKNIVYMPYPFLELLTISFFGAASDRLGRRGFFVSSLLVSGTAVFLYSFTTNLYLLGAISGLFGIGAAMNVASSLAIVADLSSPADRGKNMGLYDAAALGGLGVGFGSGFLLMDAFPEHANWYFRIAAILFLLTALLTYFKVKETRKVIDKPSDMSLGKQIITDVMETAKNRFIRVLLPIWIPVICLYGIVLTFAEDLAHGLELTGDAMKMIGVLGLSFISIFIGFVYLGSLSDTKGRKPFLLIGMVSFASFFTVMLIAAETNSWLLMLPFLMLFGLGCGSFPPAALALLADISESDKIGSSMGTYSVVYGVGLIIGPLLGAVALELAGMWGMVLLVWLLGLVSVYGTLKLPEELNLKMQVVES